MLKFDKIKEKVKDYKEKKEDKELEKWFDCDFELNRIYWLMNNNPKDKDISVRPVQRFVFFDFADAWYNYVDDIVHEYYSGSIENELAGDIGKNADEIMLLKSHEIEPYLIPVLMECEKSSKTSDQEKAKHIISLIEKCKISGNYADIGPYDADVKECQVSWKDLLTLRRLIEKGYPEFANKSYPSTYEDYLAQKEQMEK